MSLGILTPAVEAKNRRPKSQPAVSKHSANRKAKKYKPAKVKKARRSSKMRRAKPQTKARKVKRGVV